MRVLLLTPMPPSAQGLSATPVLLHALLEALRARHEVTLVTVAGPYPQDVDAAMALRRSGLDIHAVPRVEATRGDRARRWVAHTARWAFGRLPMRTIWFHRPEVQQVIDRLAAERRFDLVHVEDNAMGIYRLPRGVPSLFTEHEVRTPRAVEWTGWTRSGDGLYRGLLDEIDWRRWPRYHREVWCRFDLVQALTARDARVMLGIAPSLEGRVRINPFAVDIPPRVDPALEEEGVVVFTANFLHPPNGDAARWLIGEIMPRLRTLYPGVRLRLVGSDPRASLGGMAAADVEVLGWVPSVRAELARAAVVVAPVRIGGGQRMKVLEAMATGKAVVTTARGADGLLAREGESLPLAFGETADEIATQTAALLRDAARRRALGERARELVVAQHGISAYGARTEAAYAELMAGVSRGGARMTASVPILMYHEISARLDPRYRKYTLTPKELERQLDWLRANEYRSVTMDDVLAAWRGTCPLPPKPVAITFDDGGRDCIEHAVPALVQRGFTATFYIVAGVVGGSMRWLREEIGFELQAADWPALWAAEQAGMHCGAHSITHPRLGRVDASTCRDELLRGRAMLEDGLGHAVTHLAYPFGSFSAETREIARECGYATACTTVEAIASPVDELLALPRVPVLGTETFGQFTHRVRTAQRAGAMQLRLEHVARRLGLSRRRSS